MGLNPAMMGLLGALSIPDHNERTPPWDAHHIVGLDAVALPTEVLSCGSW
jgi:hypothetical protein